MTKTQPQSIPLNSIDNMMPKHHFVTLLLFSVQEEDVSAASEAFQLGLKRLVSAIPQLGGTMQMIEGGKQKGALKVGHPWHPADEIFFVHDLRDVDELAYSDLRKKHSSLGHLTPAFLVPALVRAPVLEKPVLLVQVNILKGAVALALCLHHAFTDGDGTATIARAYAACCTGQDQSDIINGEILDRQRMMYGWGSPGPGLDGFGSLRLLPEGNGTLLANAQSSFTTSLWKWFLAGITTLWRRSQIPVFWSSEGQTELISTDKQQVRIAHFFSSNSKFVDLKSMAIQARSDKSSSEWISTNDALCSLLANCLHSARAPELDLNKASNYLVRALDQGSVRTVNSERDGVAAFAMAINVRRLTLHY